MEPDAVIYEFGNVRFITGKNKRYLEIEIEESFGDLPPLRAKAEIRFFAEREYEIENDLNKLRKLRNIIDEAETDLMSYINTKYFQCKKCLKWTNRMAFDPECGGIDRRQQEIYNIGFCCSECQKAYDLIEKREEKKP
jgi:hypothetical protein